MSFDEFLLGFTHSNGTYTPKDTSHNVLRHFGERTAHGLVLRHEEVLYLYDRDTVPSDTRTRMYFELKNSGYNVLYEGDTAAVYVRTKHFNRTTAVPVATFTHTPGTAPVCAAEQAIVGVEGWGDYCLLRVGRVDPRLDSTGLHRAQ